MAREARIPAARALHTGTPLQIIYLRDIFSAAQRPDLDDVASFCSMRLTVFTDYCLRALIYVALKGDEVATIDEIAACHKINRNHLVKVVFRLGQLGYLDNQRGKGGGVRLARSPAKINLGALLRETEDDLALVECFQDRDCSCVIEPACVLRKALRQALDAFLATLDGYTVADLLRPSRNLASLLALPQEQTRP